MNMSATVPYMYAFYVRALYVCLICMPYVCALYVRLICMPSMYVLVNHFVDRLNEHEHHRAAPDFDFAVCRQDKPHSCSLVS